MKGQRRAQLEPAIRTGIRDVAFLYYLVIQVNGRELSERRANCLHLMLVVERLRSFLSDEPLAGERHQQWLAFVDALSLRLRALDAAAHRIGNQYFAGRSPLFPDSAASLQSLLGQLDGMIELYNDRLEDEEPKQRRAMGKRPKPIDLRRLSANASAEATALVHELVTAEDRSAADDGGKTAGVPVDGRGSESHLSASLVGAGRSATSPHESSHGKLG